MTLLVDRRVVMNELIVIRKNIRLSKTLPPDGEHRYRQLISINIGPRSWKHSLLGLWPHGNKKKQKIIATNHVGSIVINTNTVFPRTLVVRPVVNVFREYNIFAICTAGITCPCRKITRTRNVLISDTCRITKYIILLYRLLATGFHVSFLLYLRNVAEQLYTVVHTSRKA